MSDSIDQKIEYQEQILDDLDDIKGSLEEESEYYDKEYQKEVLSSLKSLQKSVDSLNESDPVTLETIYIIPSDTNNHVIFNGSSVNSDGVLTFYYTPNKGYRILVYDVSDYTDISISSPASYADINGFTCDNYYESFDAKNDYPVVGNFFTGVYGSYDLGHPDYDYLYLQCHGSWSINYTVTGVYSPSSGGDDPIPEEPVEVVTTSSAVIIEGLDNLTQITTFQSFCSSLLIGIMLFLVFVKGLRK